MFGRLDRRGVALADAHSSSSATKSRVSIARALISSSSGTYQALLAGVAAAAAHTPTPAYYLSPYWSRNDPIYQVIFSTVLVPYKMHAES